MRVCRALAFLVLFSLVGCVTTKAPQWLPGTFSNERTYLQQLKPVEGQQGLNSVGGGIDVKLTQSDGLGLIDLPELEQMLNAQLLDIKQAIGFTSLPGHVYVLASPSMNARVTADGNIYVPVGMIVDIESADEMAALLAHELAHTILNHTDTDIIASIQKKATAAWAMTAQLTGELADAGVARRIRNAYALSLATEKVLNPSWTRQQETDADKLAIDILVASQRNPNAMVVLLGRLGRWEKVNLQLKEENAQMKSVLVDAAIARFSQNEYQSSLLKALTPLGSEVEGRIASLSETHLSSEERLVEVRSYIRSHHRRAALPDPKVQQWKRVAHSLAVKRQVSGVKKTNEAYRLMAQGDLRRADKILKSLKARDVRAQTYYKVMTAMLADVQGNYGQVIAATAEADQLRYPSYRLFLMNLAGRQQKGRSFSEQKLQMLYEQFDMFGRPKEYYADLIWLAGQAGSTPLEYELILRCHVAYMGNAALCGGDGKPAESSATGNDFVGGMLDLFVN